MRWRLAHPAGHPTRHRFGRSPTRVAAGARHAREGKERTTNTPRRSRRRNTKRHQGLQIRESPPTAPPVRGPSILPTPQRGPTLQSGETATSSALPKITHHFADTTTQAGVPPRPIDASAAQPESHPMASAGRTRPSLLGTAPAQAPARDFELSILDALNTPEADSPRPSPRARRSGAKVWVLLGIAAAGIGSVLLWAQIEAAPAPDGHAGNLDQAAVRAPALEPATPASAAHVIAIAPAASTPEQAQAARIEDLAASPTAAAPTSAAASQAVSSAFEQLAGVPVATVAANHKAEQAGPTKRAAPQRSRSEPSARVARAGPPATKVTPASRPARHSPSRATAHASAGKPAEQSDADVEIMAALIGHMNESNAASGTADASIADLVRHCRSLPGEEAQACQRRICQGYWGRAEACPRDRQAALRMAGSTAR